jgi:hypothetical protein
LHPDDHLPHCGIEIQIHGAIDPIRPNPATDFRGRPSDRCRG